MLRAGGKARWPESRMDQRQDSLVKSDFATDLAILHTDRGRTFGSYSTIRESHASANGGARHERKLGPLQQLTVQTGDPIGKNDP